MKILNFGSLNVDYVYEVNCIAAPGETVSARNRKIFCGGKGLNRGVAMAKASVPVYQAGSVGLDGNILLEALKKVGINTDFIFRQDSPGGHTVIQVDSRGENCILVYGGTNRQIPRAHMDRVLKDFSAGDLLLLENEINDVAYLIHAAHERGMTILFNPSPFDETIQSLPLNLVDCFILNEAEGTAISETALIENIIPKLTKRFPGAHVLLTLGEQGAKYSDGTMIYHQKVYPVKPVDTTAAGDTFLGYFVFGLTTGRTPQETLRVAAKAASITVSRLGAADAIPVLSEVLG